VGRNIAETLTATVSYAVTLTYGRDWDGRSDHIQSTQLMYSDIQKLLKRMRKAGYKVRYMVAGEYGTGLGRAHWHCIFHFYGDVLPDWDGEHLEWTPEQWDAVGGIHIPEWAYFYTDAMGERCSEPLGHVHIRKATYGHVAYALKYMMKDAADPEKHGLVHMSRKPPLGAVYFTRLAEETAENGLPIHDLRYSFEVRRRSGDVKRMRFILRGRMAEMYLQAYIDKWRELHNADTWPPSDLVSTFAEWGKLGDEERLTDARNEQAPGEESIFYSDGVLKRDVQDKRDSKTYRGWLRVKDREFKLKRQAQRRLRHGAKKRQRWADERRTEALRVLGDKTGITATEFASLSRSEQRFALEYPEDYKSLRERREADRKQYGRPSRIPVASERSRKRWGRSTDAAQDEPTD